MKLPFMQWFPDAWNQDTRILSPETKAAWADTLFCVLWTSPTRGEASLTYEQWGRIWGYDTPKTMEVVAELQNTGVADVTIHNELVTIKSRRMVREENIRKSDAERQRKHRSVTDKSQESNALYSRYYIPDTRKQKETTIGASAQAVQEKRPEFQRFVNHVMDTYKKAKGIKYPMDRTHGAVVKRLIGLYDVEHLMAFWDIFLGQRWDWERDGRKITVAHDLLQFQTKITIILEDPRWRKLAQSYTPRNESGADAVNSVTRELVKAPPAKEDAQANKVANLKAIRNE